MSQPRSMQDMSWKRRSPACGSQVVLYEVRQPV